MVTLWCAYVLPTGPNLAVVLRFAAVTGYVKLWTTSQDIQTNKITPKLIKLYVWNGYNLRPSRPSVKLRSYKTLLQIFVIKIS
jgi:hypothetical protein